MSTISPLLAQQGSSNGVPVGFIVTILVIALGIYVLMSLSFAKLLEKAGQPGWPGWVPFYNIWRMFEICGKPGALSLVFLLGAIPLIGAIISLVIQAYFCSCVAKAFGKGTGWTVGLLFLGIIFFPLLAFGDARYVGAVPEERGFPVGPPR